MRPKSFWGRVTLTDIPQEVAMPNPKYTGSWLSVEKKWITKTVHATQDDFIGDDSL